MNTIELKPIFKISEREAKEIACFLETDFIKIIRPKEGENNVKIKVNSKKLSGYQKGYIHLYFDGSVSFKYLCLGKKGYENRTVKVNPNTLIEINEFLKFSGFKLN